MKSMSNTLTRWPARYSATNVMGTLRLSVATNAPVQEQSPQRRRWQQAARWKPILVTARKALRCREGGGWTPLLSKGYDARNVINHWLRKSWAAEKDQTVAQAYRAFLAACGDWRDPIPAAPHQRAVGRRWDAKRQKAVSKEQAAWRVAATRPRGAQARDLGEGAPDA
mgnify:CR=1 FL=1